MKEGRVLVQISHPAHVHFFKNFLGECEEEGLETKIIIRDKDLVINLLNQYGHEFDVILSQKEDGPIGAIDQLKYGLNTLRSAREFEADLIAAVGGTAASHASTFNKAKSLVFTDTEHATIQNRITFPFADRICTPVSYTENINDRQVRYPGYHELSYLHPERFSPDPTVLDEINADESDTLVIIRLVAWDAIHDLGKEGISNINRYISKLENQGARVLITSESELPPTFKEYVISVSPHRIHHLMYYADLFVGESGTMAIESAVLGTPSVFISPLRAGVLSELEEEYKLLYNFNGEGRHQRGLEKAVSLLNTSEKVWHQRRENMLKDKIDTTGFITDQVKIMLGE
ncbi:DUF354 domain-containing protein [Natrarchaeobius oligotrophus]|uniref:DUF354 domain-containing protein n=1 Tax=Natrarchaeobius chitinivorans TaxID=1679083 RepID=A0A3N6LZ83_NATCH|nr:DUF354 domain-containing protein [Natrarchaeobius chitinivorans]RQG96178.1 DUF354 domain-containing protein [Natrarchaeobius chitinivorans]